MIRVWGDNLASSHRYNFDFINNEHKCILKPDDVKIYSNALDVQVEPNAPVLPINQVFARAVLGHASSQDPNQEDYLIREGKILRITQQNRPDLFLHIPSRAAIGATLVLQRPLPHS